jgi:hypothetical protein
MSASSVVFCDDTFVNWGDNALEFRLTYQGLLLAETNKGELQGARASHKQMIRKDIHRQLKRLWEIHPYLSGGLKPYAESQQTHEISRPPSTHSVDGLASRFKVNDYKFVPLITRDSGVLCSVEVLFLRNDPPGSIISAGDIDNRLKTLFDALTMPRDAMQLGSFVNPAEGEDPFFCLLEDDCLITRASVETDTLLDPVSRDPNVNDARVVVTVKTKVYSLTPLAFGFL